MALAVKNNFADYRTRAQAGGARATLLRTIDSTRLAHDLDQYGNTVLKALLSSVECDALARLYPEGTHFRSQVIMARHGFGQGEYKYFRYPLPEILAELRTALYPPLAKIANRWNEEMDLPVRYPEEHAEFLRRCH